jgi:hypothetical protein
MTAKRKTKKGKPQVEMHTPPFHVMFPITLKFKNDKEKRVCYFQCSEHLKSYVIKNKIKKNDVSIEKTEPRE